jgi:hypothetical protein
LELDTAFDQHQTAVNADPAAVKEARRPSHVRAS